MKLLDNVTGNVTSEIVTVELETVKIHTIGTGTVTVLASLDGVSFATIGFINGATGAIVNQLTTAGIYFPIIPTGYMLKVTCADAEGLTVIVNG